MTKLEKYRKLVLHICCTLDKYLTNNRDIIFNKDNSTNMKISILVATPLHKISEQIPKVPKESHFVITLSFLSNSVYISINKHPYILSKTLLLEYTNNGVFEADLEVSINDIIPEVKNVCENFFPIISPYIFLSEVKHMIKIYTGVV